MRRILAALFFALLSTGVCAAGRPNIILITVDSTRADRMGFLGSSRGLTPSLDAVAKQALVFQHAYAQAPTTVASHATLLSGTYPQSHGAGEFGTPLPGSVPFLPDLLHAKGYRTAAFVGSILLDPKNGSAAGFDRGFDTYEAGFRRVPAGQKRPADQVIARAAAWLSRNPPAPFFLWVHLDDPHAPYQAPAPFSARYRSAPYDGEIAYADSAVGKLLAVLKTRHLYDDAVIVFASDHGEALGAHGEETHGVFLYDETIQVPLLLKLPQNPMAGQRVPARVRLTDVAPTILEAAGLPVPSQMQGQSLLRIAKSSPGSDQPVYARSDLPQRAFGWSVLESWRAGKYLYIRAPRPELYDLNADPGATRNLAPTSKATLDTIASQLDAFARRFSGAAAATDTQLSSSEMQKLASLGYVGVQKRVSGVTTTASGTDPKDKIAVANKVQSALLAVEDGQPEKAVPALQQAVAADSNMYLAQYALGAARVRQKQYAEAIPLLRKAIELMPDSAWAHFQMGVSLLATADFKTAATHLEIAVARLPKFADARVALANAYERAGRKDDARRERSEAAKFAATQP